jgi:hypothetical protein
MSMVKRMGLPKLASADTGMSFVVSQHGKWVRDYSIVSPANGPG